MKKYEVNELTYEATEAVKTQFLDDINEIFNDVKVNQLAFGSKTVIDTGTIVEILGKNLDFATVYIRFNSGVVKKFNLKTAFITTKSFCFDDETNYLLLLDYFEAYKTIVEAEQKLKQLEMQRHKEEEERKLKEIKNALKLEKMKKVAEQKKKHVLEEFNSMCTTTKHYEGKAEEFYYFLGWLAKNVGVVRATVPDFLCSDFERYFGTDTPKTVRDTNKSYYQYWSWFAFEFFCLFGKKVIEAGIPTYANYITTDPTKGIHNTAFIWDLIENYGFCFGRKQNVDNILSHIPTEFLETFKEGYNS